MSLAERNRLRMQVWEIDEQIRSQLSIPEDYRNNDKVRQLQVLMAQLEQKISSVTLR